MPDVLTKEAFIENVNTEFRVTLEPSAQVKVELVEVNERESPPSQEQFSLMFSGPLETPFTQGMRDVEHDAMGTFVLFFVPIARNPDGMVYESVFNRFIVQESKE